MNTVVRGPRIGGVSIPDLIERRVVRAVILAGVVAVMLLLTFRGYFSGSTIPPWDFLGGYNSDAYQWWSLGSFFDPIEWIPSLWAGYPSALNIQNSAWYIPVGIASLFGPFTLHSSAALAALHVAFGFVGVYLLSRSLKSTFPVALVIAIAGFFGVGYFSNAEHVDIARSYALLPWVLLVLSPSWPWRQRWGIPVAALVLWQAVTGMYPGIVVSTAYVGLVWVVVYQWRERPPIREYLLPAAIAVISAMLLSLPRLLPYLLTREGTDVLIPDGSVFSPAMLGTLIFGYSSPELPNDISMRSFFVPATILVLAMFARLRHSATAQGLALAVPALLLGLPALPWFSAVQSLPGLSLSRFTMSDFKVFLILGILLLGAAGFSALGSLSRDKPLDRQTRVRLALDGALVVGLAGIGIVGPYAFGDWAPGAVILGGAYLLVVAFVFFRDRPVVTPGRLAVVLCVLTALSGAVWAFTTPAPWRTDRISAETAAYGEPISELLATSRSSDSGVERPARLALPPEYDAGELRNVAWNRVIFSGESALGGYVNLKGILTATELENALLDPQTGPAFAEFLAAPGRAVTSTTDSDLSKSEMVSCALKDECGVIELAPAAYKTGVIDYRVSAPEAVDAVFNEPYYEGWSLRACAPGGACSNLDPQRDETGLVQAHLPQGEYMLELRYQAPGRLVGWILFGAGIVMVILATLVLSRPHPRKKAETL